MTTENFVLLLKFFKENVRCGIEHPALLLMDNHESHLRLEGVNFWRDNDTSTTYIPPFATPRQLSSAYSKNTTVKLSILG